MREFPTRCSRCATVPSAGRSPGWTLTAAPAGDFQGCRRGAAARHLTRALAERAGVRSVDRDTVERWRRQPKGFTLFLLDVRNPEEFEAGHLPGFRSAPGGQLVQATDEWVGVRNARPSLPH